MKIGNLTAVLLLSVLGVACSSLGPARPLNCPVVACKGINCQSPPKGSPYMSDEWRCIATGSINEPGTEVTTG